MFAPRQLLARLRLVMSSGASGAAALPRIVTLVSAELNGDVCSIYTVRPGDVLELVATQGLNREAVGRTRLRVGEGIVGIVAASAAMLNLPDAQNHPGFAYRPETGEEPFISMLALPVRRSGRVVGVLAVQSRAMRHYDELEVEVLETVAMVVAEVLSAIGAVDGVDQSFASALQRRFSGTVLVPGLVVGLVVLHGTGGAPERLLADDPIFEIQRLNQAVDTMQRGIDALIARSLQPQEDPQRQSSLRASREVLAAYRLVAADTGWIRRARAHVQGGLTAEAAVYRVAGELRERMRRIADPYLRERVADVEDLAGRLLTALRGQTRRAAPPGAILVARRLGPADLLEWHAAGIGGLVIEEGSAAGHAAIIARALGLPMLAGLDGVLDAVAPGDDAILTAEDSQSGGQFGGQFGGQSGGQFVLRPDQEIKAAYQRAQDARSQRQAEWACLRDRPAQTADGMRVRLLLNIGLPLELDQLDLTGAEGIGLFRTEIAMLARGELLDHAEQASIYTRVLDAAGDRPVTFRTLDLGGDKLLPHAPAQAEQNPAMGWRSLRVGLDRPSLLRRQLRALLAAAAGRELCVMFPMVATVAEFRAARALLMRELARTRPAPLRVLVGTMLEVPALLWQMEALLPLVDFISVGTNDLMQFLFAADRGAAGMAGRYDLLSPPVLDLLEHLRDATAAHGVQLSVCGEAASRPLEALVLVALGYTTLSMPAIALLPVKAALASCGIVSLASFLEDLRGRDDGVASLRPTLTLWARERGVAL
jgi:phosphotransferase system enzyme I (PtsP)